MMSTYTLFTLYPIEPQNATCSSENHPCYGGIAKVALVERRVPSLQMVRLAKFEFKGLSNLDGFVRLGFRV